MKSVLLISLLNFSLTECLSEEEFNLTEEFISVLVFCYIFTIEVFDCSKDIFSRNIGSTYYITFLSAGSIIISGSNCNVVAKMTVTNISTPRTRISNIGTFVLNFYDTSFFNSSASDCAYSPTSFTLSLNA